MKSRMFDKEYILFCDESDKYGKFYSNFYGGVLVGAKHYQKVSDALNRKKESLNLFGEIKWEKITERYRDKYIEMVRTFFSEVIKGHLKIRIMFRQNANVATRLSSLHDQDQYYLLYYQFIKNAFGFECLVPERTLPPVRIRIYVDEVSDTRERLDRFRGFIHALPRNKRFSSARFQIPVTEITEVRSHDHVLMQCLDIVLGSITFRLNDKHKEKIPGTRFRGKRTKAKEIVYKEINAQIRKIHKNFNIGMSTAVMNSVEGRWNTLYGHWNFKPKNGDFDGKLTKRRKEK
jgi:hypothetical protein